MKKETLPCKSCGAPLVVLLYRNQLDPAEIFGITPTYITLYCPNYCNLSGAYLTEIKKLEANK